MALLVYNLTTSPLALAASNTPVTLPASAVSGERGPGVNVTSELRGLAANQYDALEAQRLANQIFFAWTLGFAEYDMATTSGQSTVPGSAPATPVENTDSLPVGPSNGQTIFVTSVMDFYEFVADATDIADGITIVDAVAGRWIRAGLANQYWVKKWQSGTVYIDYLTGSDQNDGSIGSPLKTPSEMNRRLHGLSFGGSPSNAALTIQVVSDLPDSEPINLNFDQSKTLGESGILVVRGTKTQIDTGVLTSGVAFDPNTNTPMKITVAGHNWTPQLNKYIEIYDGVTFICSAWIAEDLGSGEARLSAPSGYQQITDVASVFSQRATQGGNPSAGYTFKVYSLTSVPDVNFNYISQGFAVVENLKLTNSVGFAAINSSGTYPVLAGCDIDTSVYSAFGYMELLNCRAADFAFVPAGNSAGGLFIHYGLFQAGVDGITQFENVVIAEFKQPTFECPLIFDGVYCIYQGFSEYSLSFFNVPGDCLRVRGMSCGLELTSLWGTGNGGAALLLENRAYKNIVVIENTPNIVAASDIKSGATTATWASLASAVFTDVRGNQVASIAAGLPVDP